MGDQPLHITERHPASTDPPSQALRQAITAWLASAFHK